MLLLSRHQIVLWMTWYCRRPWWRTLSNQKQAAATVSSLVSQLDPNVIMHLKLQCDFLVWWADSDMLHVWNDSSTNMPSPIVHGDLLLITSAAREHLHFCLAGGGVVRWLFAVSKVLFWPLLRHGALASGQGSKSPGARYGPAKCVFYCHKCEGWTFGLITFVWDRHAISYLLIAYFQGKFRLNLFK